MLCIQLKVSSMDHKSNLTLRVKHWVGGRWVDLFLRWNFVPNCLVWRRICKGNRHERQRKNRNDWCCKVGFTITRVGRDWGKECVLKYFLTERGSASARARVGKAVHKKISSRRKYWSTRILCGSHLLANSRADLRASCRLLNMLLTFTGLNDCL